MPFHKQSIGISPGPDGLQFTEMVIAQEFVGAFVKSFIGKLNTGREMLHFTHCMPNRGKASNKLCCEWKEKFMC